MTQRKAPLTSLIGRRNGAYFVKKQRAPLSTDTGEKLGCVWIDIKGKDAFLLVSNANGVAKWERIGSGLYFLPKVLSKSVAEASAVETEGNRYIAPATATTWTEDYIYEWTSGAWLETEVSEGMSVYVDDIDEIDLYDGTDWNNLVQPVTTLEGLSDTDIDDTVAYSDADILTYDSVSAKWENNPISGDVAITNAGVATVSDLTITGEAQGDVLYFDGTNWLSLPAGTSGESLITGGAVADPAWGSPTISSSQLEDATATTALGIAVPFIVKKDISDALTTVLYTANFPQKARLIKAWVEETDTNTGNVTIDNGTNVICSAVAYGGTNTDVTDFPNIDDDYSTLATNATLRCLNSVNTDNAMVYMLFIPIL